MALDIKSLARRTAVALIGGPAFIYACYRGGWLLTGVFVIISLLALREYYGMAAAKGYAPARWTGGIAVTALYAAWHYGRYDFSILVLLCMVALSFIRQIRSAGTEKAVENTAVSLFGPVYCALLPLHALWFHTRGMLSAPGPSETGLWLVLTVLLVWSFDIFAYLVGSATGRHKLFPVISPKKSWEGLFGGIAGMGLVFVLLVKGMGLDVLVLDYFALPVLAGVASLGGDLFESVLKRDTGVKDASALLPGHGGILDRFDALFLAAPVIYWYLHLSRLLLCGGGA